MITRGQLHAIFQEANSLIGYTYKGFHLHFWSLHQKYDTPLMSPLFQQVLNTHENIINIVLGDRTISQNIAREL